MWIKFLIDAPSGEHKKGEVVELPDTEAKSLIGLKIASEDKAPAEVTTTIENIGKSFNDSLAAVAEATATAVIEKLTPKTGTRPKLVTEPESTTWKVPAEVKRYGSLRNFKGECNNRPAEQRAYEFGMWILGMLGSEKATTYCADHGLGYKSDSNYAVNTKVSREALNQSSGFLVPDQFENDLIDLRETYGVFRKYAKIVPMSSDTRSDPRRTGGLTAYVVGESTAPTSSDKTWDRVRLTAKKIGCLTKYTRELSEDAVINIGDDLAGEIAYAFANFEDTCGFVGNGAAATYAGIVGWTNAIANVSPNASSVTAASTGAWANIALADFNKVVGTLPLFAYTGGSGVAWYCHQAFYGTVMQKLALAAGGVTETGVANNMPAYRFLGFPVRITQVMMSSNAATGIPVLFGNLALGSRFGDRRSTSIRMSDVAQSGFEQDEISVVGFERFDINVHDMGTSTQAGPVVGLALA